MGRMFCRGARLAPPRVRRRGLAIVVMDCQELGWARLHGKSEAIVRVITTAPENCRQRHCSESEEVRRPVARGSRPSDGLGAVLPPGARMKQSGPDLAPGSIRPRPRPQKVVMSVALVMTAGFAHFTRNTSGEASLGGGAHQLRSARQAILQFLAETRAKSWGTGNSSQIWKEFTRAAPKRRLMGGRGSVRESSCREITRLHVTFDPANRPRGSP